MSGWTWPRISPSWRIGSTSTWRRPRTARKQSRRCAQRISGPDGDTMTRHRHIGLGRSALVALLVAGAPWAAAPAPSPAPGEPLTLFPPEPLVPGAKVVTLWPAGSPTLKPLDGWDRPEV